MAAVIATLIATSESPPTSKKFVLRSMPAMPRHWDQMRSSVASICEAVLVAGTGPPSADGGPPGVPDTPTWAARLAGL